MPALSRAFLRLSLPVALALLLAGSLAAPAQTTQQAIEARLKGHPLFLRGQWAPNTLQFDLAGVTSSPSISAPFTLCGIDVKQIKLKKDRLEITGDRVGLEFDDYAPKRVSLSTSVEIKIAGPPGADYGPALDKIFADGLSALAPLLPFYWQNFAKTHLLTASTAADTLAVPSVPASSGAPALAPPAPGVGRIAATDPAREPLRKVGGGVIAPVVIDSVEPEFSDQARAAKFNGSVIVGLIVNSQGIPENVHVIRGVGMGLDENAVRAVQQYRFRPATENGNPVPVLINVEINFQVFKSPKPVASSGIHPPQPVEEHEPVFTDAAKQLRYTATSLLHIMIKEDGTVVDPYVIRPAGLGLDEEALRAVGHYRFKPATRSDGTPIPSVLQIEVHFQVQ